MTFRPEISFHLVADMGKMIGSDFEKGLAGIKSAAQAASKGAAP